MQAGHVTDLGNVYSAAVNNSGVVIGNVDINGAHPFLYANGAATPFGQQTDPTPALIDGSGRMVGHRYIEGPGPQGIEVFHAARYVNGVWTDIVPSKDIDAVIATQINASGDFVGYINTGFDETPFLFDSSGLHRFSPFGFSGYNQALALNDLDQIVGWSNFHAAILSSGERHGP